SAGIVRPRVSSTISWRTGSGNTRPSHASLAGTARLSDRAAVGPKRIARITMPTTTAAETSHTRPRAGQYRMSARASYATHARPARRARVARARQPALLWLGSASFGTITGVSPLIAIFGMILGPLVAGVLSDQTGSYVPGFPVLATLAAARSVAFARAKRPSDRGLSSVDCETATR